MEHETSSTPEARAQAAGPLQFAAARLTQVRVPLREPFRISSGEVRVKDALVLELCGDGASGWGESSAMSGSFYSDDTPERCRAELLDRLLPAVLGRPFASVLALNAHLETLSHSRFARVAIETAAWDYLARCRNQPLRDVLGLPASGTIPCGLAIGLYATDAELLDAIHRHWRSEYARLKIKIKRGQDVALVKAVRREFGDIPLFVDANADYTREDAAVFEQLDEYGLMMFEQPYRKDDLEGAAHLQARVRTPVCLDEGIETADDARAAIAIGACRIVNIKLQRVGGYLEALRIADVCHQHGVAVWIGTMPELGVGSAQALALTSHPAVAFPTDVHPSQRWYTDDIVEPPIAFAGGGLVIPPGPGSGYRVDETRLERHTVERWRLGSGTTISRKGPR